MDMNGREQYLEALRGEYRRGTYTDFIFSELPLNENPENAAHCHAADTGQLHFGSLCQSITNHHGSIRHETKSRRIKAAVLHILERLLGHI
jgi:hypothetical protein